MSKMKIGLQLYSVRDDMEKDMEGTLKAVKEMGYDYVEFAGYFGKSAEEVRALLDKYDLKCISVHQGYDVFIENPEKEVKYLQTIGAQYSAIPWMDVAKHKGAADYDKTISDIKKVGEILKNGGITLLYHNHDFEFNRFEGKFLLDWLYETIPADLLKTEIDTCWVRYAGYDPCEYIVKYSGRSPIVHLKDFVCDNFNAGAVYALIDDEGKEGVKADKTESNFKFQAVGDGVQNIPDIIAASEKAGAEYLIVEQDHSPDMPAMDSAKRSRDYLKNLGL